MAQPITEFPPCTWRATTVPHNFWNHPGPSQNTPGTHTKPTMPNLTKTGPHSFPNEKSNNLQKVSFDKTPPPQQEPDYVTIFINCSINQLNFKNATQLLNRIHLHALPYLLSWQSDLPPFQYWMENGVNAVNDSVKGSPHLWLYKDRKNHNKEWFGRIRKRLLSSQRTIQHNSDRANSICTELGRIRGQTDSVTWSIQPLQSCWSGIVGVKWQPPPSRWRMSMWAFK